MIEEKSLKNSNARNIEKIEKIGIIGAGAYGTALAQCFAKRVQDIVLVNDISAAVEEINEKHTLEKALPGVQLNPILRGTVNFDDLADCDLIFAVVPAKAIAAVCEKLKERKFLQPIVICSKGIDLENLQTTAALAEKLVKNEVVVLSGASFAKEIASGLDAAVNVASKNFELAEFVANSLSSEHFRLIAIEDYVGLQIAGAFKNVLAIGCGILRGQKSGASAAAAFMVDGLGEIIEIAEAFGGKKDTFFAVGGIGDIILTCTDKQSRNVSFGMHLATGGNVQNWTGALAEGVFAAQAIPRLEKKLGLKLPNLRKVYEAVGEVK